MALSISAAGCGTLCFQKTCKTQTSSTLSLSHSGPVLDDRDVPWARGITPPASHQRDGTAGSGLSMRRAIHEKPLPRGALLLRLLCPHTARTAVRESEAASQDGHLACLKCREKPGGGARCPPLPLASSGLRTAPLYPSCWKTKQRSMYKYLQHMNNTPRNGKVRNRMGEIFTAQKSHKRLVFRIHKELLKFNNNTNHSLKMVKQALRKEDVGMANDHVRRCSLLFGTQYRPTEQLTPDRQSQV